MRRMTQTSEEYGYLAHTTPADLSKNFSTPFPFKPMCLYRTHVLNPLHDIKKTNIVMVGSTYHELNKVKY